MEITNQDIINGYVKILKDADTFGEVILFMEVMEVITGENFKMQRYYKEEAEKIIGTKRFS